MTSFDSELKASTLVEVLVTMILSGLLLLAVYDGLELLNKGLSQLDDGDDYGRLDWLEHYEILEFRSDSVRRTEMMNIFYNSGEPCDTLVNYGF